MGEAGIGRLLVPSIELRRFIELHLVLGDSREGGFGWGGGAEGVVLGCEVRDRVLEVPILVGELLHLGVEIAEQLHDLPRVGRHSRLVVGGGGFGGLVGHGGEVR